MFGPGLLGVSLGLAFVVIALVALALRGGVPHVVMALGMAAMAVPSWDPLPRWAWVVVFGVLVTFTLIRLVRLGPAYGPRAPAPAEWQRAAAAHGIQLAAAAFMLVAFALPHAHGPSLLSPLAWLLAACFLIAAVHSFTTITRGDTPLMAGCTTVMSTGMAAMSLTMA